MATNGSLDEVQQENAHLQTVENALVQTVVYEDDFVGGEFGSDTDEQATGNDLEIMEPKEGMAFGSVNDAFVFYERYARKKGFSITRRISSTLRYFTFACSRQGNGQFSSKNAWKHHQNECPAKIILALDGPDNKFFLSSVTLEHNHDLSLSETTQTEVLICNKKTGSCAKRRKFSNGRAENCANKKSSTPNVQAENRLFGQKDPMDNLQSERKLKLSDAYILHHFFFRMQFRNPSFFYVMDFGKDSRLRNAFWADARSRAACRSFSDVMTVDTTYLMNKKSIPLVPFVGVNHHRQSILLGCGLLSDETTAAFLWLFKSWPAMSNKPPKVIITDQCVAIQDAIEEVFPQTCHTWCLRSVMKKMPENLSGFQGFQSIVKAFSTVLHDSLTHTDFGNNWRKIIDRFGLHGRSAWLTMLYCNRHKWVPAYVKNNFCAGMFCTQSISSVFHGHFNSTATLDELLDQYYKTILDMDMKETDAEWKSSHEVVPCITHYDIEKQFQTVYTNKMFEEFQEQLKGKMYCYPTLLKQEGSVYIFKVMQDVKIREQQCSLDFTVWWNRDDCDGKCTCNHFEFRGILCSHIITVLALLKVKEVPSKYVLQRWREDLERRHRSITKVL